MKDLPVMGLLSIIFGILILFFPQITNYLLGLYLILVGLLSMKKS